MIINKSFNEAEVPHQLKKSNVSPIIKNKDFDPKNLKELSSNKYYTFCNKSIGKSCFLLSK